MTKNRFAPKGWKPTDREKAEAKGKEFVPGIAKSIKAKQMKDVKRKRKAAKSSVPWENAAQKEFGRKHATKKKAPKKGKRK